MAKVRVFTAEHHNPWFNLATEEWLFDSFNEADHLLF
jgi:lipoate-protein ligase A